MALLLPQSVFFHIPKTGGTWVRAAIAKAGIPVNEICNVRDWSKAGPLLRHHVFHAKPHEVAAQGRFGFAFVRHPLSWYRSLWAFHTHHGKDSGVVPGPRLQDNPSFHEFIGRILREGHPLQTVQLRDYTGGNGKMLEAVGRQESLTDDLVRILREAGETFDEAAIRALPPVNVVAAGLQQTGDCIYTPEEKQALCRLEAWTLNTFGYDEDEGQ